MPDPQAPEKWADSAPQGPGAERSIIERIILAMQDNATTTARLQLELSSIVENVRHPLEELRRLVTDHETGLWVKHRHLERNVETIDRNVANLLAQQAKRLEAIEEKRRYLTREVLVGTILAIVVGTLGGYLGSKLS